MRALRFGALATALLMPWLATAQTTSPPSPTSVSLSRLFFTGASSSNGADLTEDALSTCAYTIPANQLANVGDTVIIRAGGSMGATTDNKTARVKTGATVLANALGVAAGATAWMAEVYISKTGPSAQSFVKWAGVNNTFTTASPVTLTLTDTATIPITVTGQNTTNSVAGSITCNYLTVDFLP